MKRKDQVKYGRIGGSKTGPTKKRGTSEYYAALAAKRWAKISTNTDEIPLAQKPCVD